MALGFWAVLASAPVLSQAQFDLDAAAASMVSSGVDGDRIGRSVAVLGDVNGDGHDDFLLGAPASGAAARAYVVFGGATGLPPTIDPALLNGGNGFAMRVGYAPSGLGIAVTALGDINGDGHPDFAVGVPYAQGVMDAWYGAGKAYVVFGRGADSAFPALLDLDNLDGNDGFVVDAPGADWDLGATLADAGDFDGDGLDDLLVGAVGGGVDDRAWIVRGSTAPFPASINAGDLATTAAGFELHGALHVGFGRALAGVGDFDGDGRADVAIGAPQYSAGSVNKGGRVYLVRGRTAGSGAANVLDLDASATTGVIRLDGDGNGDYAGSALAGVGDVNDDGVPDIVVGAPGHAQYVGAAYIVFGGNPASQSLAALVAAGGAVGMLDGTATYANNMLGAAVAGGRDLDGDGVADVVVGMPGGVPLNDRNGSVFVIPGRTAGDDPWPQQIDLATFADGTRWNGVMRSDSSDPGKLRDALALATGGDVNGDGQPDLLVGSMHAEAIEPIDGPWQGKAWLPVGPPYDDTIFRDGFELPASP